MPTVTVVDGYACSLKMINLEIFTCCGSWSDKMANVYGLQK